MVRRFLRRHLLSFLVLAVATCSVTRVSSFVRPPLSGSCSRCPRGGGVVVGGGGGLRGDELAGAITDVVRVEVERLEGRLEQRLQALREELKQDLRQALGAEGGSTTQRQRQQQQQEEVEEEEKEEELEQGVEEAVLERALRHITSSIDMWYATPLCARSIFDLTGLLTDADFHMLGEMGEDPTAEGRARLVRRVTARLVREDVPGQLRRGILDKLERAQQAAGRPPVRLLGSDGRLQGEALSTLRLQHEGAVAEALELLDGMTALKDEEQQMLALEHRDGVGVMCLVAAAFPHLYLHNNSSTTTGHAPPALLVPPRELHCGLRFHGYLEGSSGLFKLGTVGWSKDMQSTVRQLGQCLGALRWLLTTCLPPEKREKRLGFVGRYYLLRKADEHHHDTVELEEECREEARDVWGYGFGVMDMRSALGFEV